MIDRLSLRLSQTEKRAIAEAARKSGISVSEYVRETVARDASTKVTA
jgi:uncharacterized protein (DUF1778 family)